MPHGLDYPHNIEIGFYFILAKLIKLILPAWRLPKTASKKSFELKLCDVFEAEREVPETADESFEPVLLDNDHVLFFLIYAFVILKLLVNQLIVAATGVVI